MILKSLCTIITTWSTIWPHTPPTSWRSEQGTSTDGLKSQNFIHSSRYQVCEKRNINLYFCFSWNFYLKSFLVFMLTDRQTISFLAETWEILVNLFMHISESNMLSESNNNSGLHKGENCFLNLLLIISLLI